MSARLKKKCETPKLSSTSRSSVATRQGLRQSTSPSRNSAQNGRNTYGALSLWPKAPLYPRAIFQST